MRRPANQAIRGRTRAERPEAIVTAARRGCANIGELLRTASDSLSDGLTNAGGNHVNHEVIVHLSPDRAKHLLSENGAVQTYTSEKNDMPRRPPGKTEIRIAISNHDVE